MTKLCLIFFDVLQPSETPEFKFLLVPASHTVVIAHRMQLIINFLLTSLLSATVFGQHETCQNGPNVPSITFLSPQQDTTISVPASGSIETRLLVCGVENGGQGASEIIVYLNSNIVHRERTSNQIVSISLF